MDFIFASIIYFLITSMACEILVPRPGIESMPLAVGALGSLGSPPGTSLKSFTNLISQ